MKLRCELHLNNQSAKLILVPKQEEKLDHLALKLAAFSMFLSHRPNVDPSSSHPALSDTDFRPDMMALEVSGEIALWVECGFVTLNKLDKVARRFPRTRLVVLKATPREAERLRADLEKDIRHHKRVEIWSWPDGQFKEWMNALQEKTEIYGEAREKSFNLVINETAIAMDLLSF